MKTHPNLFIVGSPKCGTTSLVSSLEQLPEIFVPKIKEPNHFLSKKNSDLALCIQSKSVYSKLYKDGYNYRYRIDASTSYFIDENSPEKIYRHNSKAKIIILIREPIARTLSHFKMEKYTYKRLEQPINSCLRETYKEDYFGMKVNPYIENSNYYKYIKRWQKVFGNSLFVGTIEDPHLAIRISEFLGIKSFELKKINTAKVFRISLYSKIMRSFIADRLRLALGNRTKSIIKKMIYKKIKNQNVELEKEIGSELELILYKEVSLLKEDFNIDVDLWTKE